MEKHTFRAFSERITCDICWFCICYFIVTWCFLYNTEGVLKMSVLLTVNMYIRCTSDHTELLSAVYTAYDRQVLLELFRYSFPFLLEERKFLSWGNHVIEYHLMSITVVYSREHTWRLLRIISCVELLFIHQVLWNVKIFLSNSVNDMKGLVVSWNSRSVWHRCHDVTSVYCTVEHTFHFSLMSV